ncbi:MAG TPA: hypothetical protein EYN79_06255 [Planctomycetes bacterium]|nr:hypothetical protein [Planctomycetota bacterium]HIN80302.1 hypothetical protein [Planctomycetota bacterium]
MSNRSTLPEVDSPGNLAGDDPRRRGDEESDFDFGDVFLGVIYAIIIPTVVFFGLSAVGLPVGTRAPASPKDSMIHNEQLKALNPAIIREEVQLRVSNVERMMKLVDDYLRRSRATDDNQRKGKWLEFATAVLGRCRGELEDIQKALPQSRELSRDRAVGERIQLWLATVAELERVIAAEDPFKAVRG